MNALVRRSLDVTPWITRTSRWGESGANGYLPAEEPEPLAVGVEMSISAWSICRWADPRASTIVITSGPLPLA